MIPALEELRKETWNQVVIEQKFRFEQKNILEFNNSAIDLVYVVSNLGTNLHTYSKYSQFFHVQSYILTKVP